MTVPCLNLRPGVAGLVRFFDHALDLDLRCVEKGSHGLAGPPDERISLKLFTTCNVGL